MVGLGNNGGAEQGRKFEMGGQATMLLNVDAAIARGDIPLAQVTGGVIHDAETGDVHKVGTGIETDWDEGRLRDSLLARGQRLSKAMRRLNSGRIIGAKKGDGPPEDVVYEADLATMRPRTRRSRRDLTPQPVFEATI